MVDALFSNKGMILTEHFGETGRNTLGLFLHNVLKILPRDFTEIARGYTYMLIALF